MNQRDAFLSRWNNYLDERTEVEFVESVDSLLAESNKEALQEASDWRQWANNAQQELNPALTKVNRLEQENRRLVDAIEMLCDAYPESIFGLDPEWAQVHEALKAIELTTVRVSAAILRQVLVPFKVKVLGEIPV